MRTMTLRYLNFVLPLIVLVSASLHLFFSPLLVAADDDTPSVTLSVNTPLAAVGDTLIYTLVVSNSHDTPLTEVVIHDQLDPRLEKVQVLSSSAGQAVVENEMLVVRGVTLQPDENITVTLAAQISNRAMPGDVISNVARFQSAQKAAQLSNSVEVMVLPASLPATGESLWWRTPMLLLLVVAWVILVSIGMDVRRRRYRFKP